jgi:transposase
MTPQELLKQLVLKKNILQVSKLLGVSRQTVYNWLKGTHGMTYKNFEAISKISNTK